MIADKHIQLLVTSKTITNIALFSIMIFAASIYELSENRSEVNPTLLHLCNSLLFLILLVNLKAKREKLWAYTIIFLFTITYEILRHIIFRAYPVGFFHFLYFMSYFTLSQELYIEFKSNRPPLPSKALIFSYMIMACISVIIGHYQIWGY